MKNTLRVFGSALGVLLVLGSLAVGHNLRTWIDMGRPASTDPIAQTVIRNPGLRASNTAQDPMSPSEYFYAVTHLLQMEYVDPIQVDDKMAAGAVKGMVNSLVDPDSNFMAPVAFKQFNDNHKGIVEGVGVEVRYVFDPTVIAKAQSGSKDYDPLMLLPRIVVAAVLPGSSAEAAGLKAGDEIRQVGDKYVVTAQDITKLRDTQTAVTEKRVAPEVLEVMRKQMQERVKANIPPSKVRDQLTLGDSGKIDVVLSRDGQDVKVSLEKKRYAISPVSSPRADGSFAVRLTAGAGSGLAKIDWSKPVTLDLRQSTQGDFKVMQECLDALLPAGKVGVIGADGGRKTDVSSKGPGVKAKQVTVLVDGSTSGAAAALAEALAAKGFAKLDGKPYGDPEWIEEHALDDGSGYTLAVGHFQPTTAQEASK